MRIRPLLLTCFGVVGLLAAAGSSYRTLDAYALRARLSAAGTQIDGLRLALAVSERLASERAAANTAFTMPGSQDLPQLGAYTAARNGVDAAWGRLAAHESGSASLLGPGRARLDLARRQMLASLRLTRTDREPDANDAFVAEVSEAQAVANAEADRIERAIGELSPDLGQLVGLARMSAFLREALGQRSSYLSPLLGGAPATPRGLQRLDVLTGVANAMWNRVRLTAAQMPDRPMIVTAADTTARTVMGEGERTYQAIMDAARAGEPPPLDLAAFRAWTSPMLGHALLVRNAAFQTAAEQRAAAEWAALLRIWQGLAFAGAASLVCALASIQVMRRVARPLSALTAAVTRIADGDLATPVPGADCRDELGEAAAAVLVLRDRAAEAARHRADTDDEQRRKLLAAASLTAAAGLFEEVSRNALARVADAEAELSSSARSMDAATSRTAEAAQGAAYGVTRAATSVASVATAAAELAVSVKHASVRMAAAAASADSAATGALLASRIVTRLSETAKRIGDIVGLIADVASRTNLLALNATIEAARAGEAGRGFAVVASEVKSLAAQTARATDDVGLHVAAVLGATRDAIDAIEGLAGQVGDVSQATAEVAAVIEQQEAATNEIARAAGEAALGTSAATGKVSVAAGETETAKTVAASLPGLALAMADATSSLRHDVGLFLSEVRAAA